MVQGFPELHRINHSMAAYVLPVMFVKVISGKHKACYLLAVLPEPDIRQITAHAYEKCASKNIRGLKTCHIQNITSFSVHRSFRWIIIYLIFSGRYDRK